MEEIYELNIYCGRGLIYSIFGERETLMAELTAWQHHEATEVQNFTEAQESFAEYVSPTDFEVRTVHGWGADVSGRMPVIIAYRFNEVQGMTLARVR
jgi:hypothetical protein